MSNFSAVMEEQFADSDQQEVMRELRRVLHDAPGILGVVVCFHGCSEHVALHKIAMAGFVHVKTR